MTMTKNNNLEQEVCFDELLDFSERELNLMGFTHEINISGSKTTDIYRNLEGDAFKIVSVVVSSDHRGYNSLDTSYFFNGIKTNGLIPVAWL